MDKEQLIEIVSEKVKLLRAERDLTQEQMAEILGLSKKTLVQIEKKRVLASWTTVIAICALFRNSEILQDCLGGDPLELIEVISLGSRPYYPKEKTLGGKVWWNDIKTLGKYRLQKNLVSRHYRILDAADHRWASSFDQKEIMEIFVKLTKDN